MDWAVVIAELQRAIPVVVGGLLAIGGGVAGQYLAHRLAARREKEKLIRDKAELLISALYEHRDWLGRENNRLVFGTDLPEHPSPLDKAHALQELYFPEVSRALVGITETLPPIVKYFYSNGKARLADKAKWLSTFNGEEFSPLYQAYLKAFHAAIDEVVNAARRRIET